jgi:hypothetical protein
MANTGSKPLKGAKRVAIKIASFKNKYRVVALACDFNQ